MACRIGFAIPSKNTYIDDWLLIWSLRSHADFWRGWKRVLEKLPVQELGWCTQIGSVEWQTHSMCPELWLAEQLIPISRCPRSTASVLYSGASVLDSGESAHSRFQQRSPSLSSMTWVSYSATLESTIHVEGLKDLPRNSQTSHCFSPRWWGKWHLQTAGSHCQNRCGLWRSLHPWLQPGCK